MTARKPLADTPKQMESKPSPPKRRRTGGLLSYVRPGFKLPAAWDDIPETDGDVGLADK